MASCRIALTKGRLEANSVAMFERMGYDMAGLKNKGRRLIIPVPDADVGERFGVFRIQVFQQHGHSPFVFKRNLSLFYFLRTTSASR